VRVCVVSELYPRHRDPVLGIWAHEQARAAVAAGVEVRVLVLHRPVPPRASLASPRAALIGLRDVLHQPPRAWLDGIDVGYVPFLAPPRPRSYGSWGAWAAPPLAVALHALHRRWPFDLVHAHYAVPAGEAVRRAAASRPLVVSVHGGDVLATAHQSPAGAQAVRRALGHARLVLANSADTARRCTEHGARATRVVHLGSDLPAAPAPAPRTPVLVSVGHLVARKRHADLIRAVARLADRHPALRCEIAGEGPEHQRLEALARELGVADRVALLGQLAPAAARARARAASVFVLPSTDEAFGVAYVEAMAGGVPAIGCRGEGGPEEIAAAGPGLELVTPGDAGALAETLHGLLVDEPRRRALGADARATVAHSFTWAACGQATATAYADALS